MSTAPVVILDFGSQFTQLIARTVRQLGVYCEIEPFSISIDKLLTKRPQAIILSGGPSSVGKKASPSLVKEIFEGDLPVLGICYGMQLLSHLHSGRVGRGASREYGHAELKIIDNRDLFEGLEKNGKTPVWMSHGDSVEELPTGATLLASSEGCPIAAFRMGRFYAVQFHPEVAHTVKGTKILSNFLFRIAGLKTNWQIENFLESRAEGIKKVVGKDHVIGGVSGGVDSTILAVFLGKLLGKQFHPILVDNGLLRKGEAAEVKKFLASVGVNLKVLNASSYFLSKLSTVTDPERKRRIIGKSFIDIFERECRRIPRAKFLAQGTLYPDVIESVSVKGPSHTIKTHHNVGGLPKRMKLALIEPFRELFKDEVRKLGLELGVPRELIYRHPFPGPGLAVRILGQVTRDRLELLRKADSIFIEELRNQSLYEDIWQAFVVLLPIRSVGVMGDARTYENVVSLRAVTSRDGMTADWFHFEKPVLGRVANRIINEVPGINRVVYDISSKPPATIEWE